MKGVDLACLTIDCSTPADVRLLHNILTNEIGQQGKDYIDCENCGTAMRFLTAFYACKKGRQVVIDGCERMRHRPIGQLVDALRQLGADIRYVSTEGYPPLLINGTELKQESVEIINPQSTQFVSALKLIGIDVKTNISSPYIDMTNSLVARYSTDISTNMINIESDWSSAAFWYEYAALYGSELLLSGLKKESLQGDKIAEDIYRRLGVETYFTDEGVLISRKGEPTDILVQDFSFCPDLYPAVYATCHVLGVGMQFTGLESLPLKESDRLQAMEQIKEEKHIYSAHDDHRIAMALIVAGYMVDNTDCIKKSYPLFIEQWKMLQS